VYTYTCTYVYYKKNWRSPRTVAVDAAADIHCCCYCVNNKCTILLVVCQNDHARAPRRFARLSYSIFISTLKWHYFDDGSLFHYWSTWLCGNNLLRHHRSRHEFVWSVLKFRKQFRDSWRTYADYTILLTGSYILYLKTTQKKVSKNGWEKYATAYETKISGTWVTEHHITSFSFRTRFPELITGIDLHTSCGAHRCRFTRQPFLEGWRELTYVRLLRVVHGTLTCNIHAAAAIF